MGYVMKIDEKEMEQRLLSASRITECRKLCGLKQKDIAKELHYCEVYISEIVNCKKPLTEKLAREMAYLFNETFKSKKIVVECVKDIQCRSIAEAETFLEYKPDMEHIGNGILRGRSTCIKKVTSAYLLGLEDEFGNIPNEDLPLRAGIEKVLSSNGYSIKMGFCPDILDKLYNNSDAPIYECIYSEDGNSTLNLPESTSSRVSWDDSGMGHTIIEGHDQRIELTPLDTKILLEDIEEAILSIVKRTIVKKQYQERFNQIYSKVNPDEPL